jgi:hypothetical protein
LFSESRARWRVLRERFARFSNEHYVRMLFGPRFALLCAALAGERMTSDAAQPHGPAGTNGEISNALPAPACKNSLPALGRDTANESREKACAFRAIATATP